MCVCEGVVCVCEGMVTLSVICVMCVCEGMGTLSVICVMCVCVNDCVDNVYNEYTCNTGLPYMSQGVEYSHCVDNGHMAIFSNYLTATYPH